MNQEEKYNQIYKKGEFKMNLPDYKITNYQTVNNKKILVLGAGTARDVRYLAAENKIIAVDFSMEAVSYLKKLGIEAFKADLDKALKFKSNQFDIIIAKDILEHLITPSILLHEISRLLKSTGYAVIDVPNHFFLPMRIKMLFGGNIIWKTIDHDHTKEFREWNYMHKTFFTWKGFKEFLNTEHLKITKEFFDFGTLNHYSQPEMVFDYVKKSGNNSLLLNLAEKTWKLFNLIFPLKVRSTIVSLSPSLWCASFYVWVKASRQ